MKLERFRVSRSLRQRLLFWGFVVALVGGLLLYRLGTLTGGLSGGETVAAAVPVGWHGMYHQPFYLPLEAARSVVFWLFADRGVGGLLARLPSAFFGGLAILSFAAVARIWHGRQVMLLATALFATSAWVLHSSRWASFDVLYLWAIPTLWLVQLSLKKRSHNALVWYGSLMAMGLLLYIPGLVWLVLASLFFQRAAIMSGWRHFRHWWQRLAYILGGLAWLPLLIVHLTRPNTLLTWLGLPRQWPTATELARQFALVPYHLLGRGPHASEHWLGRLPILDVLTLVAALIGMYFYVRHWRAARTRLLAIYGLLGIVLVGVGGPVSLSLLVPLLYLAAATGLASLLHRWYYVFPRNPLARSLGLGLLSLAVGLSCLYNLRQYFVAWPHNAETHAVYRKSPV